MPAADTVRVMVAAIGLASTDVSVRASSSSTQENMKQKNAVTPMPGLVVPFLVFTALYIVLGIIVVYMLRQHIARV